MNNIINSLDTSISTYIVNLIWAVICSLIMGFERELTGHRESIKINVIVAVGACIFASYEILMGIEDNRIAANIVTGVGFLCSGFIFKNDYTVNGLSTAATCWCSAGIGILCSRSLLLEAFFAACFMFILNFFLSKTKNKIKPLKAFDETLKSSYAYNIVCLKDNEEKVKKIVFDNVDSITDATLESFVIKEITEEKIKITIHVSFADITNIDGEVLAGISKIEGVFSSGWNKTN